MGIAIIYGGSRPGGNTETLAEMAVNGLEVERIYLKDLKIQPIEDMRHAPRGFSDRNDDYNSAIERIAKHDTLIFATPIYWYSMTGLMKNFIDRWSHTMRDSKYPDFKQGMSQKKSYVIAVGGDQTKIKGLPMIQQFQYIFDFMGIQFEGYILGTGNSPGDIMHDKEALFAAEQLHAKLTSHQQKA